MLALQAQSPAERVRLLEEALRLESPDALAQRAIDSLDEAYRLNQDHDPLAPTSPEAIRLTQIALDALPTEAVVGIPTGSAIALALYGAYAAYRK